MREQRTKTKTKLQDNTHSLSPLLHLVINQPLPTYPIAPIICNNNTMVIEFLVQMRQSNKCGSVRNDISTLHLGSGVGP